MRINDDSKFVIRWRDSADDGWVYGEVFHVDSEGLHLTSRQGAPRGAQLRSYITHKVAAQMQEAGNLEMRLADEAAR